MSGWRVPPPIARSLIRRGFFIWLGLEALAILAGGLGSRLGGPDAPWVFTLHSDHFIPMIIVVLIVARVDVFVRDETLFFGNLGLGPWQLVLWYVIPAVSGEAILALL